MKCAAVFSFQSTTKSSVSRSLIVVMSRCKANNFDFWLIQEQRAKMYYKSYMSVSICAAGNMCCSACNMCCSWQYVLQCCLSL